MNVVNNKQTIADEYFEDNFDHEKFTLNVYNHMDKNVMELFIEDYLVGVLAAEMPALFSMEALKAQAVAARTYAFGRMIGLYESNHSNHIADVCTNSAHCQAWISMDDFVYRYKDRALAKKHWKKFEKAVNQTRGLIIKHEDKVANPLYHSSSANLTEEPSNVWEGVDVPYLQSVVSLGDDLGINYKDQKQLSVEDFLLKLNLENNNDVENLEKSLKYETSESGRVINLVLFGEKFSGNQIRKMIGLSSTNFKIEVKDQMVTFYTLGFGHGVGMSQWGANYLALNDSTFEEILKHYYSSIDFDAIY